MKNLKSSLLVIMLISLPLLTNAQTQPYLTLGDAQSISERAEARARQDKWNVVIAIMDAGGNLISLRKMDGTQVGSVEVAQAKAKTAVFFKRPTKVFQESVAAGNVHVLTLPNVTAVEGGLPIFIDGIIVGSIGVSGVTSEQDGIIAEAGLKGLVK